MVNEWDDWTFPYQIKGDIDNVGLYFNAAAVTAYSEKTIKNIIFCVADALIPLSVLNSVAYPFTYPTKLMFPYTLRAIKDSNGKITAQDYIDLKRNVFVKQCDISDGTIIPIETPLPAELIKQWRSYYGFTRVYVTDTNGLDIGVNVTYTADTKLYVNANCNDIKDDILWLKRR